MVTGVWKCETRTTFLTFSFFSWIFLKMLSKFDEKLLCKWEICAFWWLESIDILNICHSEYVSFQVFVISYSYHLPHRKGKKIDHQRRPYLRVCIIFWPSQENVSLYCAHCVLLHNYRSFRSLYHCGVYCFSHEECERMDIYSLIRRNGNRFRDDFW